MIVFKAQGGLGNQLFQYATARKLALKLKCPLVIDQNWFLHPQKGETSRKLELFNYSVVMQVSTRRQLILWWALRSRWAFYFKYFFPINLIVEKGYELNKEVINVSKSCYLSGYWQSESYFYDIRDTLIKELTPLIPPSERDKILIEIMAKTNSVSLHVRRGDYVTSSSASKYHGLCSKSYYDNAIQTISNKISNISLFIFSDDPVWVKNNITSSLPTYYVNHNSSEDSFQDLRLMTMCKHHIIANSSFSWWGAWLSKSTDGIVIAPKKWFAINRPTQDLIPSNWIKLDNQ